MDKIRIFLMGGTKESIEIIKFIKENYDSYILTTTTTEYGSQLAINGGSDDIIAKPLPKDEIINILKENKFDIFIDATHPYASHVTQTAIETSEICKIPYIRFERPISDFEDIDKSLIYYVNDFEDAGKLIRNNFKQGNVLHFAGANTMSDVLKYVDVNRFYPRILEVESSIEKCKNLKIPQSHIIPMKGTSTEEENIKLIEKFNGSVIISKESGKVGGVISKIKAANKKNIPIIIITRPKIEKLDKKTVVSNLNELNTEIKKIF